MCAILVSDHELPFYPFSFSDVSVLCFKLMITGLLPEKEIK